MTLAASIGRFIWEVLGSNRLLVEDLLTSSHQQLFIYRRPFGRMPVADNTRSGAFSLIKRGSSRDRKPERVARNIRGLLCNRVFFYRSWR